MHGWGHGDRATNDYFAPLETYGPRLDELLELSELARARHVRRIDPRRVGGDGEPVTLEQRHGDLEVIIARPFGRQMRAPEIDGVEAERADPAAPGGRA